MNCLRTIKNCLSTVKAYKTAYFIKEFIVVPACHKAVQRRFRNCLLTVKVV